MTPTQYELMGKMFALIQPLPDDKSQVENVPAEMSAIMAGYSTEDIAAVAFTIATTALMNTGNLRIDLFGPNDATKPDAPSP